MYSKYFQLMLLTVVYICVSNGAVTTTRHTTVKPTVHHHHHHPHATHSSEKVEKEMFTFHYDSRSIEPLLVAKKVNVCYAYPLSEAERKGIHDVNKILLLEAHVLHQVRQKAYGAWDYDDLAVRSTYFGQFCPKNGTVYQVYRL